MVTVCSREVPEVPHPVQFQDPPETGCGPNCTELPALIVVLAVCCQLPPFTRRYGVMAVAEHPPLEEELLEDEEDELELLDDDELLEEEEEPVPGPQFSE